MRGQCESANEEKQHNCQGLPGAGQTWLLGGARGQRKLEVQIQHGGQEQAVTSGSLGVNRDSFLTEKSFRRTYAVLVGKLEHPEKVLVCDFAV